MLGESTDFSPASGRTSTLDADGFATFPHVLDGSEVERLIHATAAAASDVAVRERAGRRYAVRNVMALVPAIGDLARSGAVRALVEPVLGRDAFAVRALLFDKTVGANWKVALHQDLSIAVRERRDVPGFGPWSVKAGVQHVQPPACVLERMLTARLHLDDCGPDNGPLLVLPGSHAAGVLSPEAIREWRGRVPPVACLAAAGGAVLMRPLLLHASSEAASPRHRRVVHIEFTGTHLPSGLEWAERSANQQRPDTSCEEEQD